MIRCSDVLFSFVSFNFRTNFWGVELTEEEILIQETGGNLACPGPGLSG